MLREQEDASAANEGEFYSQWLRTPALVEFTRLLVQGVTVNQAELDAKITAAAENWSVPRMAATDRSLLRLGCYELYHTDTPVKVVIDEAVELAKLFGGAQSAKFVNGIMDKLMQKKEKEVRDQKSEVSDQKSEVPGALRGLDPASLTSDLRPPTSANTMGIFNKLQSKVSKKTAQFLNTDIRDLFKQEGKLVDE